MWRHHFHQASVDVSVYAAALLCWCRRFYLLFQQHCRYDNATTISRTIGEYSYHMVSLSLWGPGCCITS